MEAKGFIAILFDLSFSEFITTRIIKVLFVLGIFCAGLWSLSLLGMGLMSGSFFRVLAALVFAPVFFLLSVLWMRVSLEMVIAIFRIAENTGRMVDSQTKTEGE